MSIVRWDPWGDLAALSRDINRTLGTPAGGSGNSWLPPADIFRTDEAFVIRMDVPGMRDGDLQVTVEDGQLTVTLERHADEKVESDQWIRRERGVGVFERSFSLPENVDTDNVHAEKRDGVLHLKLMKRGKPEPKRIEIKAK